ncbi:MAG: cytochrome c biogenesis protein CcdA [Thermodesulfobacteriota bacterium]|nr:cytochrome c biogenesis protein CcdA [Thermodesulfobacteriota bacterium]
MSQEISLVIALAFGFLTFFSPCILPLIPAYISFITGCSVNELKDLNDSTLKRQLIKSVFFETLLFVLGFSLIFIALGASATYIGNLISYNKRLVQLIGGIIVVLLGLHITGIFNIKYLDYEKRFHLNAKPTTLFGSFVVGVAFAVGWTPCIGPILGGILTYAATQNTVYHGILLLSVYSLGLGIPFVITGLFIGAFFSLFQNVIKYSRLISIGSGSLLIVVGVFIMSDNFKIIQRIFIV